MKRWMAVPLFLTAFVAGCSQAPVYQLTDADRSKYSQSSPEELIAAAQERLKKAEADQLPVYAPISYKQAKAAIEEAVKAQQKRGPAEAIITGIAAANSRLDAGYQNKEKSRALLAPNYASDKRLLELQAPTLAASAYKDLLSDMADIYQQVDRGEMAKAEKSRAALAADQQALKAKLVKAKALTQLKAMHDKLDDDDADEVVPVALEQAERAYKELQGFIDTHVDDSAAIAEKVGDATVLAQRAQWMADRARKLAEIDTQTNDVEKIVTEEEKWLTTIQGGIGGETVRHLTPEQQAAELAERARELKARAAAPAEAPNAP